MFLTSDGASPNVLASRILTEELQTLRNFLLIPCPCYSHIVCNAVGRSQPRLDITNLSRAAQVMESKTYGVVLPNVAESISTAAIADRILPMKDSWAIWSALVKNMRPYRGPFTLPDKRGKSHKPIQNAALAFPNGFPMPWAKWGLPAEASEEMLTELADDLPPIRNFTGPCLPRWYTVETFCWQILGCALFGILPSLVGD